MGKKILWNFYPSFFQELRCEIFLVLFKVCFEKRNTPSGCLKKVNNWFTVNTGFIYTAREKEAATQKFSTERPF